MTDMKKFLSLILAMQIIIGIFGLTAHASADEALQTVFDTLTEEMLTTDNEPEYSVTKNLNLNLAEDLTLPNDVSVSFTSSDPAVIANDGTVKRAANVNKRVTLTAAITKSGCTPLEKKLNFTVLSLQNQVIVSDNIYYPQHVNQDLITYTDNTATHTVDNWTLSNYSQNILEKDIEAKFTKDKNGYYGITSKKLNKDSYNHESYIQYNFQSAPPIIQREGDLSANLTLNVNPVSWSDTGTYQFYLRLYSRNESGKFMSAYMQFWRDRIRIVDNTGRIEYLLSRKHVLTDQNNRIDIKLDYNQKLYYLTLNGETINAGGSPLTDDIYKTQLAELTVGYFRGMTDAVMQVNDVTLTRATAFCVDSLASLTPEIVANGQDPDFITENLLLPVNEDIVWSSDKPDIISSTGIVNRPELEDEVVTLTAAQGNETKNLAVTVKSIIVSQVAINSSFTEPYYGTREDGQQVDYFTTNDPDNCIVQYENAASRYYAYYRAAESFAAGQQSLSVPLSSFPIGSSQKYIFEFDACFDNKANQLFVFTGDDKDAIRFNNALGELKVSNSANVWYNIDNQTYATIPKDTWISIKMVLDFSDTPTGRLYLNSTLVAAQTLIEDATFHSSIGMYMQTRWNDAQEPCGVKFDNFKLYTESAANNAIQELSNDKKAKYMLSRITLESLTTEPSYDITQNLTLNKPLAEYDLADLGVNVSWQSTDGGVIAENGTVTRPAVSKYVIMTVHVTAGTGEEAVNVSKKFPFTVAAADSSVFRYNYNFDTDPVGTCPPAWKPDANASAAVRYRADKGSNALMMTFSGAASVATVSSSGGAHDKCYFVSADVCFEPDSEKTSAYFNLIGAGVIAKVGFDFKTGGIYMMASDGGKYHMVPGVEAKTGEWYHIDLAFNAARKNYTAYINGAAITAEPVDIPDALWQGWYYIRSVGINTDGSGKAYIDNVIVRQSHYNAPVYDENSDYTVRSIRLTNQNDTTITNASSSTTKVKAVVKLIKNRVPQNGRAEIILTRCNTKGQLVQLVTAPVDTAAPGYETMGQLIRLEMPLLGDCSGDTFKVFVLSKDKLIPLSANYNSAKDKFDTDHLFHKAPNPTSALSLGYNAESSYNNIEAIMYDGDTYCGRQTKHFAYIGLPEGASSSNPVPAVVCVHGGGGSAYDEWVKHWNDRGYAAIAMNLNGRIPQKTIENGNNQLRHAWPGATQDNYGTVSPDDATWMYSAVTAVIMAHNVLRDMPEVDNSKIGIIGVSWGGVVTATAIGVDNRFAFAVPSYGCGYLYEAGTYMSGAMTPEKILWDPSNFIVNAEIPILWMNGDVDGNFPLNSTTKSILLKKDNSYPAIIHGFGHSHNATWSRPESYAFADSIVKGGEEFVRGDAVLSGNTVTVTTNRNAKSAALCYTTASALEYKNGTEALFSFSPVSSSAEDTNTFTFTLPPEAKKFYIAFTDEQGLYTSTILYDVE